MNKLSDAIGKICEALLPIPEEFYIGNTNSSICVCTLSSIKLLKEIICKLLETQPSIRLLEGGVGEGNFLRYLINQCNDTILNRRMKSSFLWYAATLVIFIKLHQGV
mgnify:CR=1 FL=1